MGESGNPRVFLCHAKEDKARVRELYRQLKAAGYAPWLDEVDLLPGQAWRLAIKKIITDPYNLVVVCLSRNSITKRGVVQEEIAWALDVLKQTPEGAIYLIPARLEECEVPDRLADLHWVNLFEPGGFEYLKRSLDFELGKRKVPQALPAIIHPSHPFEPELILIPAGEFLMGSDLEKDEEASDDELPQHKLYLPDYYIAKTPVTNAQYLAFVEVMGYRVPEHWEAGKPPAGKEQHPVVNVTWHDALAYCQWLSQTTGRAYALPSEAEWAKAARGTDGRIYPWGDHWDAKRCNTRESGRSDTTLVGYFSPQGDSPYGGMDMVGNVWEWTRSLWRDYPYKPDDGREVLAAEGARGLCGGSWGSTRGYARVSYRYFIPPDLFLNDIGLRVVLAPVSPS
jgi:formylglycine-generating enzyme required for sulfatase activity